MTVLVEYIGDTTKAFDDAVFGRSLSTKMYDDGACIIYHAAGDSGSGLFTAAVERRKIAIGVDSDQYEVVAADQEPHVDHDVDAEAGGHGRLRHDRGRGRWQVQGRVPGVRARPTEGISYATSNPELMSQDIVDQVDESYKEQILDGDIKVPTEPENANLRGRRHRHRA